MYEKIKLFHIKEKKKTTTATTTNYRGEKGRKKQKMFGITHKWLI